MKSINRELKQFRGSFTDMENKPIPAYKSGYAFIRDDKGRPTPAPFPYITYDVVSPNFRENAALTADIWDKNHIPGDFTLIDRVLEQVREKIPAEGVLLGNIWLKRNPATFTAYMSDPDDQLITRGIINLILQNSNL